MYQASSWGGGEGEGGGRGLGTRLFQKAAQNRPASTEFLSGVGGKGHLPPLALACPPLRFLFYTQIYSSIYKSVNDTINGELCLCNKKSQILPNCVPHALDTDTYLPPPFNPYNLILPPFGQKAERNPEARTQQEPIPKMYENIDWGMIQLRVYHSEDHFAVGHTASTLIVTFFLIKRATAILSRTHGHSSHRVLSSQRLKLMNSTAINLPSDWSRESNLPKQGYSP